jgi:4-amino-4-deoxy-L-arabinose transferase-like glycosyltransferase
MDGATWRWGGAALAAGLLLRAFFVHIHPRFLGDTLTYGDLAHNLLTHHVFGFTENVIRPTLIRLPGYPLFVAACFTVFGDANYLAVLWVQVAVDLVTCALLGLLAARLMGRRAGLAVVWLAALCPFTANYAGAALTETLSLFCVTLAFFGLERWVARWREGERGLGWAAVVGGAAAFAVLLRPDQGLLAAAVVPVMLWVGLKGSRKLLHHAGVLRLRLADDGEKQAMTMGPAFLRGLGRAVLPALIAALIVALPLGLWAARNWRTFHVVQPLAPRYANDPGEDVPYGFQRWYRTWAIDFKSTVEVYWNYDGNRMSLGDLPSRAFDSAEQKEETRALYARYNAETSATPAFDAAFAKIAGERVAASPVRYYVLLPVARELNMWLRPRTELMKMPIDWWAVRVHPRRSAFEIGYAVLNAAYLVLALIGLWRWWASRWSGGAAVAAAMLGFVVLRCALVLTVDNSEPRYVLECYPVVILLAGFALRRRDQ